jgi:cytosine/uracil/thiamine/allantoin permease
VPVIAYMAGIATSVRFMSQQAFTGYIAAKYLQGADISYFAGFLVSGTLYLILARPRTTRIDSPARSVQGSQAG